MKEIDETIQRAQAKEQERLRAEKLEQLAVWKQERELKKREIDEEKERLEEKKQLEERRRLTEKIEQKKLIEQIRHERDEMERMEHERQIREQRLEHEIRQKTATSAIRQFRQRVRDQNFVEENTKFICNFIHFRT